MFSTLKSKADPIQTWLTKIFVIPQKHDLLAGSRSLDWEEYEAEIMCAVSANLAECLASSAIDSSLSVRVPAAWALANFADVLQPQHLKAQSHPRPDVDCAGETMPPVDDSQRPVASHPYREDKQSGSHGMTCQQAYAVPEGMQGKWHCGPGILCQLLRGAP